MNSTKSSEMLRRVIPSGARWPPPRRRAPCVWRLQREEKGHHESRGRDVLVAPEAPQPGEWLVSISSFPALSTPPTRPQREGT